MKPVKTLVIIASEAHARLLENRGMGKGLVVLESLESSDFEDIAVRYSDVPGRSSAAPGMAVHAMDRVQSERDQMREAFVGHVLEAASAFWRKGGYDRLALAAPPKTLGSLRKQLDSQMKAAVAAELNKDLIDADPADLADHFGGKIVF